MITQSWLLFVLALLLGFITFVIILWTIIKWKHNKDRNIGCGLTFLFSMLTIICTVIVIVKVVETIRVVVPNKIEEGIDIFTNSLSSRNTETPFMDSLKLMQPTDSIIPNSYFSYAGLRDYFRMPLIYPYSITAIDGLEKGTLQDEKGIKYIAADHNENEPILHDITYFTFDRNILLAKTESSSSLNALRFYIFNLNTRQLEEFNTEKEMKIQAAKFGFDTIKPMITIQEYFDSF